MNRFLDLGDFPREQVKDLLGLAARLQQTPQPQALVGKVLGLLFLNPSLRTLASFQSAMMRLGGTAVVITPGQGTWQMETRAGAIMNGAAAEHVREAVPVLASYCDAIGIRMFAEHRNLASDLAGDGSQPPKEDSYIRFITMLQMSHRQMFMDALEGKWASGYDRALAHIRVFLKDIDPDLVNQRLMLMSLYLRAAMSSREAALEGGAAHRVWSMAATMENFIDTVEGMLKPKPSKPTLNALMLRKRGRASAKRSQAKHHEEDVQAI